MQTHFGRVAMVLLMATTYLNAGNTIHVPANQPTIQAGIAAAGNGDTVLAAAGIYFENINFMGKAITVTSEQGAALTVIDGQAADSVVTFATGEGRDSLLSGFTIQNGLSCFNGGGIAVSNASPTIENNVIRNNRACQGAGISVAGGSALIRKNTIDHNAQFGGGIGGAGIGIVDSGAAESTEILNNTIVRNSTTGANGGGISLFGSGTETISGNIISENTATGFSSSCPAGGGVSVQGHASPLIVNNLIAGNRAGCKGGGVYWLLVPAGANGPYLTNNTIAGNTAAQGSGVFADGFDAQAQFVNNIVSAPSGQYAVYCGNFNNTTPPTFLFNDIVGDVGSAYGGICNDQTGLNGNISLDPLFFDSTNADFRLTAGSPAIDAGTAANAPTVDLDGNLRPIDGNNDGLAAFDIGAFEAPQVTVTLPDLTATKIDNVAGSVISPHPWTWSIATTNHGGLPAAFTQGQVILRDSLPASGAAYGTPFISTTHGISGPGTVNCALSLGDLVCAAADDLSIGAAGTFTVQLTVTPSESGTFANPRGGGVCSADPDGVLAEANKTNNQCADAVVVPGADVQLSKVITAGVSNGMAIAGSNVTYLLTVKNNGPTTATNLVVKDVLPANTTFVSCVPSTGSCVNQLGTVAASIESLANGSQVTVTIVVTVAPATPGGTVILNTATATTSPTDPNPANNTTIPVVFTVGFPADLHLTKVISAGLSAGIVNAGSNVTYLITVTNNGPNTAFNVSVQDTPPSNTTFVSCVSSVGACNFFGASFGSLANGAQASLTIVVTVGQNTPNGTVINNVATVSSSNPDPNPSDNSGSATFTVEPAPPTDLQLTNVSLGATVGIAEASFNVTYLVTVSNNGPNAAANVVISDTLPFNAAYVSCSVSVGNCGFNHVGTFSVTLGSLASGARATLTIVVNAGCTIANGTVITNTASVSSPAPDPTPGNNSSTAMFTVRPPSPTVSASVLQNVLTLNNHEFVNVGLTAAAAYNACPAATSFTVQVYGNEDDQTPTAKNEVYSPDAASIAIGTLRLRAERVDAGNGRVYLIVVTGTGTGGQTGFGTATVVVPKSSSTASVASVLSQAVAAAAYANANNGGMPPGYFVIGDGPVIGPKQ